MKLNRSRLRDLIAEEIISMEEDVIVPRSVARAKPTPPLKKSSVCEKCGGSMYEGQCAECGYVLEEGHHSSGCGGCDSCSSEGDYSTKSMHILDDLDYESMMRNMLGLDSIATPGEAAGIGYQIGKSHHAGAYMAKSQMYKVSKYAQKLYHMIPDGHNLEDWMRTKLAQISDDISEVYHALEHDIHQGDV